MSTALATRDVPPPPAALDPSVLERVVCDGDLSKLTPAQKVAWYRSRCEAAGLDPRTQPFQYLSLQGKLTLYATKACTEQLRKIHGVSVVSLDSREQAGVWIVTATVKDSTGRIDSSIGAVPIRNLQGDALANALMKAETKAKRRATLSLCGLGMLDESELETIPDARPEPLAARAVESADPPAEAPQKPARAAAARTNRAAKRKDERAAWEVVRDGIESYREKLRTEYHTDEAVAALKVNDFQVRRHLVKVRIGKATEGMSNTEVGQTLEGLWADPHHRGAVLESLKSYLHEAWLEARRNYAGDVLDSVSGGDPTDAADPDCDYPDEPGANG